MVSMRKNKNGANFKSLYTANTVAALYSAQLGDSNELRLAAIGRYGDTPPYRYRDWVRRHYSISAPSRACRPWLAAQRLVQLTGFTTRKPVFVPRISVVQTGYTMPTRRFSVYTTRATRISTKPSRGHSKCNLYMRVLS